MSRALRLLVALGLIALALTGCNGGDDGTRAASSGSPTATGTAVAALGDLPVPRTEVSGATWRGGLVVAGGLTADGAGSVLVHTYDPDTGRWLPAPSLPVPLHHAGMAVLGERLFVAGGYTNGPGEPWVPQAAVRSLGPGDRLWRDERPLPGGPRGALGLGATGGRLVAVGGEAGGQALARTEVYDTDSGTWREGPRLSRPREHLAVTALRDRVYAIAGRTAAEGNLTVVESLDPVRDRAWREEPDLHDARGGIGAAAVDGRLCVAGGEEAAGTIASVECLDDDQWVRAARLAFPRHGLAVTALGGRLHVVAGGERPGLFVSGTHEALDL